MIQNFTLYNVVAGAPKTKSGQNFHENLALLQLFLSFGIEVCRNFGVYFHPCIIQSQRKKIALIFPNTVQNAG